MAVLSYTHSLLDSGYAGDHGAADVRAVRADHRAGAPSTADDRVLEEPCGRFWSVASEPFHARGVLVSSEGGDDRRSCAFDRAHDGDARAAAGMGDVRGGRGARSEKEPGGDLFGDYAMAGVLCRIVFGGRSPGVVHGGAAIAGAVGPFQAHRAVAEPAIAHGRKENGSQG